MSRSSHRPVNPDSKRREWWPGYWTGAKRVEKARRKRLLENGGWVGGPAPAKHRPDDPLTVASKAGHHHTLVRMRWGLSLRLPSGRLP